MSVCLCVSVCLREFYCFIVNVFNLVLISVLFLLIKLYGTTISSYTKNKESINNTR